MGCEVLQLVGKECVQLCLAHRQQLLSEIVFPHADHVEQDNFSFETASQSLDIPRRTEAVIGKVYREENLIDERHGLSPPALHRQGQLLIKAGAGGLVAQCTNIQWRTICGLSGMKRTLLLLLVLFAAIVIAAGIIRSRAVPAGDGTVPEIVSFTASPDVTQPGQPVTLAWNVRGARSVDVDSATKDHPDATRPERGGLPGKGQITVHPNADTVYTLTCQTADGPMCSTSVTVRTQ